MYKTSIMYGMSMWQEIPNKLYASMSASYQNNVLKIDKVAM